MSWISKGYLRTAIHISWFSKGYLWFSLDNYRQLSIWVGYQKEYPSGIKSEETRFWIFSSFPHFWITRVFSSLKNWTFLWITNRDKKWGPSWELEDVITKPGPVISVLKNVVILSFLRKFLRNLIGFPKMVINRLSLVRIGPHWSALVRIGPHWITTDGYGIKNIWVGSQKVINSYHRLSLVRFG